MQLEVEDNRDHTSNELFAQNHRELYRGFALGILRSNKNEAGNVELKVSTEGLKGAKVRLVMN